jgi:molecular chaperone GrpE (heat shock protein)
MVSLYPGQKANELAKAAQERYEQALKRLEEDEQDTNKLAEEYGNVQFKTIRDTIGRFICFIESTGQKTAQTEKQLLDGIELSVQQLQEFKAAVIGAQTFFTGGVKAAGAAAAGYGGAVAVATSIGVASTGTAISTLSGAAATNAMLAWFGGGAIAAGGGGMAVGVWVLGGITAIPAVAIGGFMAAREGKKAMTKACEHVVKVNKAIAEINAARDFSGKVRQRIAELKNVFESLNTRALEKLVELESQPFNSNRDAEKFQQLGYLMKGLAEILKARILTSEGAFNLGTVTILEKYRSFSGK